GGEGKRVVQQSGTHAQRRFGQNLVNFRLAGAVPVFKGSFDVGIQEIDRGEEIPGIRIPGIEAKGAPKLALGLAESLLFKRDSGQLDGKALLARRLALARRQAVARFLPALQVRHGHAVIEIEVGSGSGSVLQQLLQILPALLLKKLPGKRRINSLRARRQTAQSYRDE